jgi:hypothetical protein
VHELAQGDEDHLEARVVGGELAFQLGQSDGKLTLIRQHSPHPNERPDHEDADLDRPL